MTRSAALALFIASSALTWACIELARAPAAACLAGLTLVGSLTLWLACRREARTGARRTLAAIVRGVPAPMLVVDPLGTIVSSNAPASRLFGHEPGSLDGTSLDRLVPHAHRRAHQELVARFFEAPRERRVIGMRDIVGERADGTAVPVGVALVALELTGERGMLAGGDRLDRLDRLALAWIEDLSERKERERELKRSNEELEQFSYVASHDLKEPLRMIASFADLLDGKYGEQLDERARRYLYFIVDGAKRMQRLIDGVLAYARLNVKSELRAEVELERVFALAARDLSVLIDETKARVSHDPLPCVMGDERQLTMLFENLLSNAIKFRADAAPIIHVSVEREGASWHLAVTDNGVGFDPTQAGRLFQMFQRLHERALYEGSGLGLAIVHRIVTQHGGRIWAHSERGKGSTFHFSLPALPRRSDLGMP